MAHSAVEAGAQRYAALNHMIRARLFKGLTDGQMNVGSLMDDERLKILSALCCSYCGSLSHPSLDHIFPRAMGGGDTGDNLVFACRSCNSSKGKKDLLVWFAERGQFPPLSILRRYLKLSILNAQAAEMLPVRLQDARVNALSFSITSVPMNYPKPAALIWAHSPPHHCSDPFIFA